MREQSPQVQQAMERVLPVDFTQLPEELRNYRNWVGWTYTLDEKDDLKKPPINPRTGNPASITNPDTWGYLADAKRAYQKWHLAGVGIVLTDELGLVGLDFDGYVKDGVIDPRVAHAIPLLNTYFEYSPSGNGLRGFFFGVISGEKRKNEKAHVEMYSSKRYFTITGQRVQFASQTVSSNQQHIDRVYKWFFPQKPVQEPRQNHVKRVQYPEGTNLLAADDIIRIASDPRNDPMFYRYYNGDSSLWMNTTKSNADFIFCLKLAFWTHGDEMLIDEIFRKSRMFDAKWDRPTGNTTYGKMTIKKAVDTEKHRRY